MSALTGALMRGRRLAESLMLSTVSVTRLGATTIDSDGRTVPDSTPVYSGRARIVRPSTSARVVDVAGAQIGITVPQVHFPVGSYAMQTSDVCTVTANPSDPSLVGHRYRLTGEAPAASLSVAYRVQAEEIL